MTMLTSTHRLEECKNGSDTIAATYVDGVLHRIEHQRPYGENSYNVFRGEKGCGRTVKQNTSRDDAFDVLKSQMLTSAEHYNQHRRDIERSLEDEIGFAGLHPLTVAGIVSFIVAFGGFLAANIIW